MFVCPECGESHGAPGACLRDGAALIDGSVDPLLGQLVGPYRVACRIGAGGMGQVYKGVHPGIGSRVAIKVLAGDFSRHSTMVERFFSEARAVNVIRHENIVNVLDLSWLPDGRPYIVMEFLDGSPLSAVIRGRGALPLGSLVTLTREVLDALAAAHDKGIVHRDLKPDNIFVTPGGRAKVLDFGIAKLRPDVASAHGATETGSILGTPQYMSPEQALGRAVDHRADIYSLGIILFEGSTGRLPFTGGALFELLKQHIEAPPPIPQAVRPDMPPTLSRTILRALEKDPARRFGSARELAAALVEIEAVLPRDSFPSLGARASALGLATPHAYPAASYGGYTGTNAYATAGSLPGATGYTTAGLAHTRPSAGRRSRAWIIALFAAFAVLGLGVLGVLGVALVAYGTLASTSDTTTVERDEDQAENDREAEPPGTSKAADWDPSPPFWGKQPDGIFDAQHVIVADHFLRGERIARKAMPDAELVRIDVMGVNREGIVNLEISGDSGSMMLARWRSPSLSKRPANLPVGAKHKSPCVFYYMVNEMGLSAYTVDHMGCDEAVVPRPKCTVSQVLVKAEAQGGPKGNYIANVSYYAWNNIPARWYVHVGDFTRFFADDC